MSGHESVRRAAFPGGSAAAYRLSLGRDGDPVPRNGLDSPLIHISDVKEADMNWAAYRPPISAGISSLFRRKGEDSCSNPDHAMHDTGPFGVPSSESASPRRRAASSATTLRGTPKSLLPDTAPGTPLSEASHVRAENEVWGDAWLRNKLQDTSTQPRDVTRVAEYMQDILSSRNKLALEQKEKIQELEEQCVKYAHDIGLLKSIVADVEDKSALEHQSMAAEIASLVKELQLNDSPQAYQTHGHGTVTASSARTTSTLDVGSLLRLPLPLQMQVCMCRVKTFACLHGCAV
jgi:hypothetical protein